MLDRYAIIHRDWQRFDRTYAVIDTATQRWVLQTNLLSHAVQCRDEMNAHAFTETRRQLAELEHVLRPDVGGPYNTNR
jgi:hypothetical protein